MHFQLRFAVIQSRYKHVIIINIIIVIIIMNLLWTL